MSIVRTNLSDRMKAVFEAVMPCETAADIGCDHGFVSIALAQSGKAKRIIACDINKGPLKAAEANIAEAGCKDRIETRLGDGLHKLSPKDAVNAIIIAGMGGALMTGILSSSEQIVKNADQLILQPQSELFLVRKYVREIDFHIEKETFLKDGGKYYWVMDVRPGKTLYPEGELLEIYDRFSGYLIEHHDPLLREYLKNSINIYKGYLKGISDEKQGDIRQKILMLDTALKLI